MSWFQKLLPPKIKRRDQQRDQEVRARRACGASARPARRCCTAPTWKRIWRCARSAATITASLRVPGCDLLLDAEGRHEIGAEV